MVHHKDVKQTRHWLVLLWLGCNLASAGADLKTEARLLLDSAGARPGDTIWAGLQLRMAPNWHTYWQNPGDSGIATKIDWTLPVGIGAGPVHWPVPEKLITASLTTYVYHGEAILLIPLTLAGNLAAGNLEIKGKVSWLECEELCVAGKAEVSAKLVIGSESKPSADATLIEAARKRLPQIMPGLPVRAAWEKASDTDTRPLLLEWDTKEKSASVDFFPYASDTFEIAGDTEKLADENGKVRLRKTVKKSEGDWPAQIAGVLVARQSGDSPPQGYEVHLPLAPVAAASVGLPPAASAGSLLALLGMLGGAFVGGLILNIMPCVLPVIALKVVGFVNHSQETPQRVRQLGLIYGAGVLTSFLVLAGLAIAVQQAGGLAGWGMAFQNPKFRVIMTVLMTLVALNLFGIFEVTLSGGAMGAAGELAGKEGLAGAFLNGVLATLLATPCTAPFLAGAIAFAFTQPPLVIGLAFLAVGLGLALPFVVLCWCPGMLRFLPKPGAWMERFKVAMGFPMLATAVWLFWLTAPRYGKSGVLWFGLFLVLLAMAAWIWGEFVQRGARGRGMALALSLIMAAAVYAYILEGKLQWRSPQQTVAAAGSLKESPHGIDWQPWSPEAVEKARREGHAVLVDFTADSCLNCQVNKITSLEIAETRAKLKAINAVAFLADFTDENETIARELKRFGRPGVPLVLVYPRDVNLPPMVLPTVLTPKIVLQALDKAT